MTFNGAWHVFLRCINCRSIIPLAISALSTGYFVQVMWIKSACPAISFYENGQGICRDNLIRLIAGPPVLFFAFLLLYSFLCLVLIRFANQEAERHLCLRTALPFISLLLMLLLPITNYSRDLYATILFFAVILLPISLYFELKKCFPPFSGSLTLSVQNDSYLLHLNGNLSSSEVSALTEATLWKANSLSSHSSLVFDLQNLNYLAPSAIVELKFLVDSLRVDVKNLSSINAAPEFSNLTSQLR